MTFKADVYRILIASPGDVGTDRDIIPAVISEWNDLRASQSNVVILPVRWETHSAPLLGDRPQEVINQQLVKDCDLLVGLFWTRIGTHTGVAESGTVEEIEYFIKMGKPAMIYFCSKPAELDKIDIDQYKQLTEFKEKLRPLGLVESYTGTQDLKEKFARQLAINIDHLVKGIGASQIAKKLADAPEVLEVMKDRTIYIEDYEKDGEVRSFLVKGETTKVKGELKQLGGKWNAKLKGWIFPQTRKIEITDYLKKHS
ncbi:hypothetical protein PA598K_00621 [Paenibacillus sp. 598K]|uniref:hypothetical protein n=1 Tax=Paenibacillus sp. 598K TaxID=1117987 RepID=UPI000FFA3D04|nr:hypothetical protein [Paenibacillus sp. 598K]GBF72372.1 hypothetical protein PA598K_00621 [Paenibacillus sp. 598K]